MQGYEDEPISKILANIGDSDTVLLDRWELKVEPNPGATDTEQPGKPDLPLNVVNNYFSFGVDAHIALEFHEARGIFIFFFIFLPEHFDQIVNFSQSTDRCSNY